ncbi:hypothetical protein CPC08DRAFT_34752 [Agrocybe pediades]|nr:hypothetical protein CPC08DRAFT_34752 [Agrocybe pediades]
METPIAPRAVVGNDAEAAKALSIAHSKRSKLEEERAALLSTLEETEAKLVEAQAEFGAIYNKSSKLLKLPPEVTCMIFHWASGYPRRYKDALKEQPEVPLLLPEVVISHVCRYWRAVSISYPRLWTSFSYAGACNDRVPVDRFKAYLERSATLDLELWLDFLLFLPGVDTKSQNLTMLEMAVAHAQRWKRVTLLLDSDSKLLDEVTSRTHALSVPKLEHLMLCAEGETAKVSRRNRTPFVDEVTTTILTGGAPNLKSLRLDGAAYIACTPPLCNLTALRIEALIVDPSKAYTWQAFLTILQLPLLEHLSIIGAVFETPNLPLLDVIEMNQLRSLRFSEHDAMCLVLSCIRAPLLDTLTMQSVFLPEEFNSPPMQVTGSYFFPSLIRLNLLDVSALSLAAAWSLIKLTKTAKDVLLSHDDSDENFLIQASSIHSDDKFWPKLETIILNMDVELEINRICHLFSAHLGPLRSSRTKPFLYLPESIEKAWRENFEQGYTTLRRLCTIKSIPQAPTPEDFWPPFEERSNYEFWENDNPFVVELVTI